MQNDLKNTLCEIQLSGVAVSRRAARILYEKSFNLKTISQGDFGHFREKNQIVLS